MTGEADSAHNVCKLYMCEICLLVSQTSREWFEGLWVCHDCKTSMEEGLTSIRREHVQRRWKEKQKYLLITDKKQE